MTDDSGERISPEQVAMLREIMRRGEEIVEHLYTTVYLTAWMSRRQGDEGIVATVLDFHFRADRAEPDEDDLADARDFGPPLDRTDMEILIEDLIDGAKDGDDLDVMDSSEVCVCLALADALAEPTARLPRFPRWVNARALATLRGESDWMPADAMRMFSDELAAYHDPRLN